MPRIVSDIPEPLIKRIHKLVDKSLYSTVDSFVRIAVENQLALEDVGPTAPGTAVSSESPQDVNLGRYAFPANRPFQVLEPASFEALDWAKVENERDLWLWGQVNRILPLKFAVRMLACRQPADANAIEYWSFARSLVAEAREFGTLLEAGDQKLERERGEGLATAFPIGKDSQKAGDRYRNLFIGTYRSDGLQQGALPILKLVALVAEGNTLSIGLTHAGLKFAEAPSPVLDAGIYTQALGDEEIEFFLTHILQAVPGEVQAYKLILSAISSGMTAREQINEAISNVYPKWTPQLVNTQRTGAMSRMYELGLFSKQKTGVTVRYALTDRGMVFLGRGR